MLTIKLYAFFLFMFLCSTIGYAQKLDPRNLLINNVWLITPESDTAGVLVNLLILDNKLEVVSQDVITQPEGLIALDAKEGYLLGKMKIGQPPSFIILREDPRKRFNVWLSFESKIIFALDQGTIHRNRLFLDVTAQNQENVKTTSKPVAWFAYTPPPFALPLDYLEGSKWNHWDTKHFSGLFSAMLALDRQFWLTQNDDSREQVGDLDLFEGGIIRGFRFGSVGRFKFFDRPWGYTFFFATNAFDKGFDQEGLDNFTFFDYRLDIPLAGGTLLLSVGKQKEPLSMERLEPLNFLPMQERAAMLDAMLTSRNVGVILSGNIWDESVSWATGLFNPWIDQGGSFQENPTTVTARITGLPYYSDDESTLLHMGIGARLSNGKGGVQYRGNPEVFGAPLFVNTGLIETNWVGLINIETSFRSGPFWLAAEYVHNYVDSPKDGKLNFKGFHLTGSWVLSGEMRNYRKKNGSFDQIPIARTVSQGGWGSFEAVARFSSVDLNDGSINGGAMRIYSLGFNWWLMTNFSVGANYRIIRHDSDQLTGTTSGLNTRILLMLN